MSSLALMRWLESSPERYDAGMRILTLGRASELRHALADSAVRHSGVEVLELGCGTGALTELIIERGASVTALDQSAEMLEQAHARLADAAADRLRIIEQTASEIDGLPAGRFDAVVASFALSEMSRDERAWVLRQARERLRPGGQLLIADEARPLALWQRIVHGLLRAPQAALGWLLAGSVSRPIPDLAGEIRAAGMQILEERRWLLGSLTLLRAGATS